MAVCTILWFLGFMQLRWTYLVEDPLLRVRNVHRSGRNLEQCNSRRLQRHIYALAEIIFSWFLVTESEAMTYQRNGNCGLNYTIAWKNVSRTGVGKGNISKFIYNRNIYGTIVTCMTLSYSNTDLCMTMSLPSFSSCLNHVFLGNSHRWNWPKNPKPDTQNSLLIYNYYLS